MLEPHDPIVTVRAGGIAPLAAKLPEGERASAVSARAYVHPAIADRVIVRLAPEAIAAGTDAEMSALGFGEPEAEDDLGQMRYRTLGFPAWALVNDPKKARFALEVTQDFRKAKKRAQSKPGHAKEAFDEIGKKLGRTAPHFLPSFWEEAGRVLADQGGSAMAAQCFEKAREAERAHKLKVDEDARDAVFVEFALLGALSAKTLSAYAKDLEKSAGAKDAYRRFRSIVVQRALGGMPPWSGMGKDVRALAKTAKLDLDKEDDSLARELIDSPSLRRAPGEFWQTYRPALARIGKEPHVRSRLRALFPEPRSSNDENKAKFAKEWFALLAEVGAFDDVPDAELADFLSKAIKFGGAIDEVKSLMQRYAKKLVALEAPIRVVVGDWWEQPHLDLAELALSLGIKLAEPKDADGDELAFNDEYTCNPVHVAAHEVYGKLLVKLVEGNFGEAEHEAKMMGKAGFTAARRSFIENQLTELETSTLRVFDDTLAVLDEKTKAKTFLAYEDLYRRLSSVDVVPALERTLRAGIPDELGWPLYEDAVRELGDKVAVEGYFPYVVVHDGLHARVIGREGVVLRHDFVLDAKKEKLEHALYLDGQLIVYYEDKKTYDDHAYWSGNPKQRSDQRMYVSGFGWQTQLESGGVTIGHLPIRAGDSKIENSGEDYDHDGTTFFTRGYEDDGYQCFEWDPLTNKRGRKSRPTFYEQYVEEGKTLNIGNCMLHPVKGLERSILGVKDGLVGFRVRSKDRLVECERIDGVKWSGENQGTPDGLVLFPGDDRPRPIENNDANDKRFLGNEVPGTNLRGPEGHLIAHVNGDEWASRGWGKVPLPPFEMWHFLGYRDEAGSRALRKIERVGELMIEDAGKRALAIKARGITHERLIAGVSGIIEKALAVKKRHAEIVADRSKEAADRAPAADGGERTAAVRKLSDAFAKGKELVIADFPDELQGWLKNARGKATRARMPFAEESDRTEAKEMMAALSGSVFEEDLSQMRLADLENADDDNDDDDDDNEWGSLKVYKDGASHVGLDANGDWMIERSTDGAFRIPKKFKVTKDHRLSRGPGAAFTRAWLALEDKLAEWTPGLVDLLADKTGLSRAESTLLAAGLPNIGDYSKDFLGKERREKLGLKVSEADPARGTFRELDSDLLDEIFAQAAGEDPSSLLSPLTPDASGSSFGERLAQAWLGKFGKRVEMPAELLESAQKDLDLGRDLHRTMSAFFDPSSVPNLTFVERTLGEVIDERPRGVVTFDHETGKRFVLASAWLSYAQPVGDPARSGVPALYAKMKKLLENEKLIWPIGYMYSDKPERKDLFEVMKVVGGDKVTLAKDEGDDCTEARDDGALIVAIYGERLLAGFRPGKVKRWDAPAFEAMKKATSQDEGFGVARTLLSDGFAALVARIGESKLEKGQFEANPAHSAPRTVSTVKKELGISEEAAALYLQLLALAEPTDRAVRRFNGWTPKQHQTAQAELVKKKLVAEGKRERAGREVFLPGGWSKSSSKDLPMEDWKKAFYSDDIGRHLPLEPMHALFARAWKRVESGDGPKLEKVR